MEMTKPISSAPAKMTALAVVAILVSSFAAAPLALAASSGSGYPMEVIRAHTVYKVVDPTAPVILGLGVHGGW